MKTLFNTFTFTAALSALCATTAFAQAPKLVTLDEFGNGNYAGLTLPSTIAVDPFSGLATLQYTLPFAGGLGDVVMMEPAIGTITDILRFDGNGHVFFFSDTDQPPFGPADGPLPALNAALPTVFIQEVGPEGNNGALYVPNAGNPGFEPTVGNLQYHFISDVPEPASGALLLLGAGLLARKSKNSNTSK